MTRLRSSSFTLSEPKTKDFMLKTMTVFDKKTNNIMFKTTGGDDHIRDYGDKLHKKLEGQPFRVQIEDSPLLGFDFQDVKEKVSNITPDRILIGINLLISIALVIKIFS